MALIKAFDGEVDYWYDDGKDEQSSPSVNTTTPPSLTEQSQLEQRAWKIVGDLDQVVGIERAAEVCAQKCNEQQVGLGEWKEMQARWETMSKREVWNDAVTHCADVIAAIGDDKEEGIQSLHGKSRAPTP